VYQCFRSMTDLEEFTGSASNVRSTRGVQDFRTGCPSRKPHVRG
jgi:hypothetical protein